MGISIRVAWLALLSGAPGAHAFELDAILHCRDPDAFGTTPTELVRAYTGDSSVDCRFINLGGGSSAECELMGARSVYGLPTREFSLSRLADGTKRVRTVFRAGPERVAGAVAAARGVAFGAEADGRRVALFPDDPKRQFVVERREDGSTGLGCIERIELLPGSGVDERHGGIAGHLSFPGRATPPMRVCALSADRNPPRCVSYEAGQVDFLIGGLLPGEYYVFAYPKADNPEGFTAAHTQRFKDCPPNRTDCAHGVLKRVYVRAGQVLTDIDPDAFYTELPAQFREPM
jgi:hypothetical protein